MTNPSIDDITAGLQSTRVTPSGVTFAGKSLKLDTENDAKEVTDQIDKCTDLQYLNLEGNTLGVEASKTIAKSLEKHPELKRAQWKDMFTGRMKTEIPKALEYLGHGLVTAGATLTELDLSDNAFGPIGVEGLAALLRSPSCFALEELRLNNNGLGITGGRLLAKALTDCHELSKKTGKPLGLKVFIAGRNRLENEGATALAEVFKSMGTLEEVAMPQNGIYHVGITALSDAFVHNKNLRIINLNDNTIGGKGALAIARALPALQQLTEINFGDCLLKTRGAISLANCLKSGHVDLEEITLGHNEIRSDGGLELIKAMGNKSKLKTLNLNGNQFGSDGCDAVRKQLTTIGKINTLGSLSEDESDDSEQEEDIDAPLDESEINANKTEPSPQRFDTTPPIEQFLKSPTADNFLALGPTRSALLSKAAMPSNQLELGTFVAVTLKVAQLSTNKNEQVANMALESSKELLKLLFANTKNSYLACNELLVRIGLLKSEGEKYVSPYDQEGCKKALKNIVNEDFLHSSIRDVLTVFVVDPQIKSHK